MSPLERYALATVVGSLVCIAGLIALQWRFGEKPLWLRLLEGWALIYMGAFGCIWLTYRIWP